jgi:hypothetical protein
VTAPKQRALTIVEIKLYRSERTRSSLLDQAVLQLVSYMEHSKISYGILVVTSELAPSQREIYRSKFPKIELWDLNDLAAKARPNPSLLSALSELIKNIQVGGASRSTGVFAELVESTPRAAVGEAGEMLAKKLEASSPGKSEKAAKEFELLCEEALKLLFDEDFTGWKRQARVDRGFHKLDLIARLVSTASFWATLASDFRTRYVIFESKNYKGAVTQSEVYSTEKYLFTSALRSVAIIIARGGSGESAEKAMKGSLREQGKLILCLSMKELCDLLRGHDRGDDPTNLLFQKLDDMLIGIAH